MSTSYRIVCIGECPSVARTLAEWHHAEWGWMNPDKGIPERVAYLETHHDPNRIPTTFVALDDEGRPLGSASLVVSDLASRPELTPWMASVYVHADARRRGIGGALVDRIVQQAHELGVDEMYLFTPDQMPLYAAHGWTAQETFDFKGETETLMSIRPAERVRALRSL